MSRSLAFLLLLAVACGGDDNVVLDAWVDSFEFLVGITVD